MTITSRYRVTALLSLFLLIGCGDAPVGKSTSISEATSRMVTPADPVLAADYDRSCRSCHTIAATGAPLTGDWPAWDLRMQKGMDILVDNVVNGFGGMPPFGLCMDCDVEQFEALIDFMATPVVEGGS